MIMKKIISLMLALVMALALVACGAKDDGNKALVMGTSADYAPYEFMYPNDKGEMVYGGIDISVGQAIADHMGKELQVENMGFDFLLTNMQNGKCDMVLAAIEVTDERLLVADFSDPYYTDLPAMILVKAGDATTYKTLNDFAGKKVGAQTATTKETIVKEDMAGAELVSLQVVTDMINQLVNGKLDALVLDGAVAMQYADANADLVVAEISLGDAYPYRVAVKEGDPKGLLESINKSIAKMLADGAMEMFISDANAMSVAALEG